MFFCRVPIAVEMLFRKGQWLKFAKWVLISAFVVSIPMIWVDSVYLGKLVVAPFNIIMYNIFTDHGPNIYGTEPFSFYLINLFLNFNFVFIGALAAPLALVYRIHTFKSNWPFVDWRFECLAFSVDRGTGEASTQPVLALLVFLGTSVPLAVGIPGSATQGLRH